MFSTAFSLSAWTPRRKPGRLESGVAGAAVPTPGAAVQQWMCAIVVVPMSPLNETVQESVALVYVAITTATPLPVELVPETGMRVALESICPRLGIGQKATNAAKTREMVDMVQEGSMPVHNAKQIQEMTHGFLLPL